MQNEAVLHIEVSAFLYISSFSVQKYCAQIQVEGYRCVANQKADTEPYQSSQHSLNAIYVKMQGSVFRVLIYRVFFFS